MKKRIIITGGAGQDGIILSKSLSKKNYIVHSIINKKKIIKLDFVKYHRINLLKKDYISKLIRKIKPHAIIHLAAKNVSAKDSQKTKYNIFYKNNLLMTKNLIHSLIENDVGIKFIFAGSSLMFSKTSGIVNENSKFKSNCYYSKYKIDAHKYILKLKEKFNLLTTTAILFNHDSIYRNSKFLLPRLVSYLKKKQLNEIKKIFNENIIGDFSHAEDICNGISLLLKLNKYPNKIIFSSNKFTKINDFINYGIKRYKIKNSKLKTENKNLKLIGDNRFAKKLLNWKIKKNSFLAFKELLNKKLPN